MFDEVGDDAVDRSTEDGDVRIGGDAGLGGLLHGTRVATSIGWRSVEALQAGDEVLTFDHGLRPLTAVRRYRVATGGPCAPVGTWPLTVAPGVLGNLADLVLLPGQCVVIESDAAESASGDPFVAIPATILMGRVGVTASPPPATIDMVTLHFAQDQIVFGAGGALFLCEGSGDLLDRAAGGATYTVACAAEAEALLAAMARPVPERAIA